MGASRIRHGRREASRFRTGGRDGSGQQYDAWRQLRADGRPLGPGDLLENEKGELRICKYVGFDAAEWVVPEPKPRAETVAAPDAHPAPEVR